MLPEFLKRPGPGLLSVRVAAGTEGPLARGASEEPPYPRVSLHDWARVMRTAMGVG